MSGAGSDSEISVAHATLNATWHITLAARVAMERGQAVVCCHNKVRAWVIVPLVEKPTLFAPRVVTLRLQSRRGGVAGGLVKCWLGKRANGRMETWADG